MQSDEPAKRIDWVDTAKGIGIILVVFGHTLRGLATADLLMWTPSFRFVDQFIYSFHMPLFFLLSGLFLTRSISKLSFAQFLADKCRTILYPYVVWSTVTIAVKCCVGSLAHQPRSASDLFDLIYAPIEQYWFLYTLFILVIAIGFLLSIGMKPVAVVAIALLVHPTVVAIHVNWYVFYEITSAALYVALGTVAGRYFLEKNHNVDLQPLCLLLIVGFGGVTVDAICCAPSSFQILAALCGIAGSLALARTLELFDINRPVEFIGRRSLEIFVAHSMASAGSRVLLQEIGIQSIGVHMAVGTMAGLAFPLVLWFTFQIFGVQYGFTFPPPFRPMPEKAVSTG